MRWDRESITRGCRTCIPGFDPWSNADGFIFDADAALRAIAFIEECCTFSTARWAGQPFLLEDWQAAIVGNLFGWKRADGTRRFRRCLIFTARKSGKTEL